MASKIRTMFSVGSIDHQNTRIRVTISTSTTAMAATRLEDGSPPSDNILEIQFMAILSISRCDKVGGELRFCPGVEIV